MKHANFKLIFLGLSLCIGWGCEKNSQAPEVKMSEATQAEPQHIQVQHILIAFEGSLPGREVERSKEEAEKFSNELLDKIKAGADFGELVKAHTDDQAPGIYGMSNFGAAPAAGEFERSSMVPAFGDVGFKLEVGGVGLAEFDSQKSPYGFHIIKRLK